MTPSTTTLKGIFPNPRPVRRKNFIQENVRNLRRMEQCFQTSKEVKDLEKMQSQKKQSKYQNVAARVNSSLHGSRKRLTTTENHSAGSRGNSNARIERKSSAPELNITTATIKDKKSIIGNGLPSETKRKAKNVNRKKEAEVQSKADRPSLPEVPFDVDLCNDTQTHCDNSSDVLRYKSRGIQTVDTDNLDGIYAEGVVRYSSARSGHLNGDAVVHGNENQDLEIITKSEGISEKSSTMRNEKLSGASTKVDPDYVKLNKEKVPVATRMAAQLNNGVLPPTYRKGVVPKYLKERKEERQQEKERKAIEEAILAECPVGHVVLPDNERKETLKLLKKNYQELVIELNMLPIRSDTLRSQRRKIEIEKKLTKLEEGIKVFSRPKVFVKINA